MASSDWIRDPSMVHRTVDKILLERAGDIRTAAACIDQPGFADVEADALDAALNIFDAFPLAGSEANRTEVAARHQAIRRVVRELLSDRLELPNNQEAP